MAFLIHLCLWVCRAREPLSLLSTGLDSSSSDHWDILLQKLRGNDVVIFPIALGGSLRGYDGKKSKPTKTAEGGQARSRMNSLGPPASQVTFAKADAALLSLCEAQAGGRAYFPKSAADFVPIYREIASALRHEYVIGIAPAHDGKLHKLTVEVLGVAAAALARSASLPAKGISLQGSISPYNLRRALSYAARKAKGSMKARKAVRRRLACCACYWELPARPASSRAQQNTSPEFANPPLLSISCAWREMLPKYPRNLSGIEFFFLCASMMGKLLFLNSIRPQAQARSIRPVLWQTRV